MRKIIVFIFSFHCLFAVSQHVEISGTAIGHPGELVRIITFSDLFSRLDTTIVASKTDVWGNFEMNFITDQPNYSFLALGLKRSGFYLDPGKQYHFQIHDDTIKGSVFDQMPLQFSIDSENDFLNRPIGNFNYDFNVFLFDNQRQIIKSKNKSFIVNFIKKMKQKYLSQYEESNTYIENYIDYTLASLEWISKSKSDSVILMDYFIDRDVQYNNIAYAEFFRDFFNEYFKIQKLYRYDELVNVIISEEIIGIDSLLLRDKSLAQNDQVREIALILLLEHNYHNKDVAKENIDKLFAEVQSSSSFEKNRLIAKNFRIKLSNLQYGIKAPPFLLVDQNEKTIQLSDFEGQFVLLDFISSACKPCLFDFQKLQEITQTFEANLKVIMIVSDGNLNILSKYCNENNFFNWVLLDLNENIMLLEDYQIKTFPTYILLNPDGTIAMAPTPLPGENLEAYIQGFMSRYQNKK